MRLLKRTYALPTDTVEQFERAVSSGKRSSIISNLIESWLEEQKRAQLRRDILEGCRDMSEVYLDTEKEYHPLEEEVERDNSTDPQAR